MPSRFRSKKYQVSKIRRVWFVWIWFATPHLIWELILTKVCSRMSYDKISHAGETPNQSYPGPGSVWLLGSHLLLVTWQGGIFWCISQRFDLPDKIDNCVLFAKFPDRSLLSAEETNDTTDLPEVATVVEILPATPSNGCIPPAIIQFPSPVINQEARRRAGSSFTSWWPPTCS